MDHKSLSNLTFFFSARNGALPRDCISITSHVFLFFFFYSLPCAHIDDLQVISAACSTIIIFLLGASSFKKPNAYWLALCMLHVTQHLLQANAHKLVAIWSRAIALIEWKYRAVEYSVQRPLSFRASGPFAASLESRHLF